MSTSEALLILTVNWPSLLGSEATASFADMLTRAVSSSAIVTVASTGVPIEIFTSPESIASKVIVTVSLASNMLSLITKTSIVADVLPAGIVTVPVKVV